MRSWVIPERASMRDADVRGALSSGEPISKKHVVSGMWFDPSGSVLLGTLAAGELASDGGYWKPAASTIYPVAGSDTYLSWETLTARLVQRDVGLGPGTSDFKIQHIDVTLTSSSQTLTAGVDPGWSGVTDKSRAILLVSGVTQQAQGPGAGGVTATPVATDTGVKARIASNSTIGIDGNYPVTSTLHLTVIEYVGAPGGPNEFLVRHRASAQPTSSYPLTPSVAFADYTKVVVFTCGTQNGGYAGDRNWQGNCSRFWATAAGKIDAEWPTSVLSNTYAEIQAVEFVGSAWTIQTGSVTPGVHPSPAEVTIASVDPATSWVYSQLKSNTGGSNDLGLRAWLSSATKLEVEVDTSATGKTVQWTVLTNPSLYVQTTQASDQWSADTTQTIAIPVAAPDLARAWSWVDGFSPTSGGSDLDVLPSLWGHALTAGGTITLDRARSGRALTYAAQHMSFGGAPGGAVTFLPSEIPLWRLTNDGSLITATTDLRPTYALNGAKIDPATMPATLGNLDGGQAASNYGGGFAFDAGGAI